MTDSTLFQMLMGGMAQPKPQGIMGFNQPNQMFPPGSPGYLLNMLFGPKAKQQDFINPNDVDFREGGAGALAYAQQRADEANGIIPGQETPSQYFQRMSGQAAGIAPTAPGIAPSGKPIVTPKPVAIKPIAKPKLNTSAIPTATADPAAAVTAPASTSVGYQAADTYKAPEPAAPAVEPTPVA
jgi:hypothetical protein